MCCTFGDLTDVQWWRELQLPTRSVIQRDGRISRETPEWITSEPGRALFAELAGKTTFSARAAVVDALRASGDLDGEPAATQRKANFYEKGDKPLEIVTSRQWYIRNGGRDADLREQLLAARRGAGLPPRVHAHPLRELGRRPQRRLADQPAALLRRADPGLVPASTPTARSTTTTRSCPTTSALPVDPVAEPPAGFEESQRGVAGGFTGDPDVMDTWATSSLTPQIAGGWRDDPELFAKVFPMDVRPQAHDIIRTWLFSTVVRSHLEHDSLPWKHATISGLILDPDRKKMSKSKGNAITPIDMLRDHGSDAMRYWAASARLGTDAALDTGQMKVGRRLAIKVLNASKFALSFGEIDHAADDLTSLVTEPLDAAMLAGLADVVEKATAGFEAFDYTRALEVTETFFWTFCDDYLELVKDRAYGGQGEQGAVSARAALRVALDVLLRLLAPTLPYATEEVWSWWHDGSVHRAAWPTADEVKGVAQAADPATLTAVGAALAGVRKAKSEAKVGMRAEVTSMTLAGPAAALEQIRSAVADLNAAGKITDITYADAEYVEVRDVVLVPVPKS